MYRDLRSKVVGSLGKLLFLVVCFGVSGVTGILGQGSQEISDDDGIPVLIKHLPEWENGRDSTVFITDRSALRAQFPGKNFVDLVDFAGGTEAVTARYSSGRLLIIEFATPQAAADADSKFLASNVASSDPGAAYRRIGNYSVFVFDSASPEAAAALLDQVRYEKTIQWLGEDPFLLQKLERYFVTTTRDIFISTVLWIIGGFGISILIGIVSGFIFFKMREQQRATRRTFSDAGGLVRLNLDNLSEN
ncbi:MAG: hypothetical protein IPM25_19395 [Chloracidobacterium sp.]|nr:hypothetical protein [Chloracidobacterium sp.]